MMGEYSEGFAFCIGISEVWRVWVSTNSCTWMEARMKTVATARLASTIISHSTLPPDFTCNMQSWITLDGCDLLHQSPALDTSSRAAPWSRRTRWTSSWPRCWGGLGAGPGAGPLSPAPGSTWRAAAAPRTPRIHSIQMSASLYRKFDWEIIAFFIASKLNE